MSITRPTGSYARQMLDPGGWVEADEDTFYDRAQEYSQVLQRVTDVLDTCRQQKGHVFEGGLWSGGAANAANGALGANINQLMTLQDYLATVITWHRHIAGLIEQAKSDIGNNVDGAQREIDILENDPSLDADERHTAINSLVTATHGANVSLVAETAERVLESKNWKPPKNALEDLLQQKSPPPPDVPTLVVPSPVKPGTPGEPTPITPVTPPVAPATPATPATPVTPAPAPHPQPAPAPAPSPGPQPVTPATPGPSGPATPGTPGGEPAPHVKPAALAEQPGVPGQHAGGGTQSGPAHADESAASVTPAAASGVPGARAAAAAPSGTAVGAGARSSVGTAAASGAGSHAATGRAPVATSDKAAAPSTRAASARTAPPARPPSTDHIDKPDRSESADDGTPVSMIPVSAARAARDAATAAASARQRGRGDALRLARRIAAALNASDNNAGDYGFFWITAVTTDGSIVVANSYGLAYIPDGMELPNKVYLASADHAIPVDEIARCATYPVLAVQAWAAFHDMTLRAVIGTAEQLASSDPGVAKIVLEPDDIPESGKMTGRSRLEVVDPSAAAQLADTTDQRLLDLLPPAPVDVNPPGDERHMLWFELMKPMTSTATGREAAHLRAFRAYAAHSQEIALHQAHTATDAAVQRVAVADWLYWQYVTGLLDRALAAAC